MQFFAKARAYEISLHKNRGKECVRQSVRKSSQTNEMATLKERNPGLCEALKLVGGAWLRVNVKI
jgi:hypothetical protein